MARFKYSHSEKVTAFFGHLQQCAPRASGTSDTSDWLTDLERRALSKQTGWKAEAQAYLQGLVATGALAADAEASCRERLAQCIGSEPAGRELLAPLAWIAVVAAMAVSGRALANDKLMLAVLGLLTAAVGWRWASTRPWLERRNDPRQGRWERPVAIGICALSLPVLTYMIPLLVGVVMQYMSIKQFNADRESFLGDPQGFPMLRELAREHYGMEVVLGDAEQSWASTTVSLPNSSVASMALRPGYCYLSLHRSNVLRGFEPVGHVDPALWVQGVMLHEFAHCLDLARDTPAFGERAVRVQSLAPMDAAGVKDIDGWIEGGRRPTTQLWREAVADIMAVGYWKLVAPGAAHGLVTSLRQKRSDAKHDTAHATMCWIDAADRVAVPSSTAELFSWADRLRAQTPCELSQRQEPPRAQEWLRSLLGKRRS